MSLNIIKRSNCLYGFLVFFLGLLLVFPVITYADDCQICVMDTCKAIYDISNDSDGDGMNDGLERQLAVQFRPRICLDDSYSDKPFYIPPSITEPPYSCETGLNHCLPQEITSNGTVYYRVKPIGVVSPGLAKYVDIAYWFYFNYSQAECHYGYWCEHGHDWEHMAVAVMGQPGNYQAEQVYYSHHSGGEYRLPENASEDKSIDFKKIVIGALFLGSWLYDIVFFSFGG